MMVLEFFWVPFVIFYIKSVCVIATLVLDSHCWIFSLSFQVNDFLGFFNPFEQWL
jgi:hypothetical protein